MAITEFNLGNKQSAERKLLVTAVNVGTVASPVWEPIGVEIEDSSVEFNADVQTVTDILGVTTTRINKMELQQSFEPYTVKGGSKLAAKLEDIVQRNALTEFGAFDVLLIRGYIGSSALNAEKHANCTVVPTSLGGSSTVDMPITVYFSNDKTLGTVNDYKGAITFTPTSES
ncbi:MAG: hypothetical protein LBP79_01270 [Clostridiales bacterium]|jgi:hypothetical protein|nr:hypothetical protein [Clostridiales bacterium]